MSLFALTGGDQVTSYNELVVDSVANDRHGSLVRLSFNV